MKYHALDGLKYRVLETMSYQTEIIPPKEIRTIFSSLSPNGVVTMYKGFCWDGATGAIDTDNIMLASAIHDCFCNWMEMDKLDHKVYWKPAARLLQKMILDEGMNPIRARYVYRAVRGWGRVRYGV